MERDAALAAIVELEGVVGREIELVARVGAEAEAAECVALGRLDLDDICSHVGQQRGRRRSGQPVRDLQDADAIQRSVHGEPPVDYELLAPSFELRAMSRLGAR